MELNYLTCAILSKREKAVFEFAIPHQPIPRRRAQRLAGYDFDAGLAECIRFWNEKLASAARIHLPERRVNEMVRAGLLHLDLVTYGKEPGDPAAACVGVYSPIGLESAPIVLFLDSMGWHDLARRFIEFFLEMQREDGFIQIFSDYLLETGGVLYMIGEHYRFTHRRRLSHDDKHRNYAAILRERDHLVRERPAI